MNVFVAGGAGYIGSSCCEYLLNHGHEVTVFDNLCHGYQQAVDSRATLINGDLANFDEIRDALEQVKPDAIMHFAAFIEVGESMKFPGRFFTNNVQCGVNLLEAAVAAGVSRIIFSSTCAIYGVPPSVPIVENMPMDPISPYGESKLMFERVLRWYKEIHGIDYVCLRYFNAAGASETFGEDHIPETHLIPLVIEAARGLRPCIKIFGDDYPTPDGTCVRDYIHILDLAKAHMLALTRGSGGYNVGTGIGHSVREVIDTVARVSRREVPVEIAERRPGDIPTLIAGADKVRQELGWEPDHLDLSSIVESAWNWREAHPDGYPKP